MPAHPQSPKPPRSPRRKKLASRSREPAQSGQSDRLIVARVSAPRGIHGELSAEIQTDFPERFARLKQVHLQIDQQPPQPYEVEGARLHKGRVLLKLAGVDDVAAANHLRNALVSIPIAEAEALQPDQFYWHDIIGLQVFTADGRYLGKVEDILRTGSNDVYLVRNEESELLIPAIEDVVTRIDVGDGKMIVELLPGLID